MKHQIKNSITQQLSKPLTTQQLPTNQLLMRLRPAYSLQLLLPLRRLSIAVAFIAIALAPAWINTAHDPNHQQPLRWGRAAATEVLFEAAEHNHESFAFVAILEQADVNGTNRYGATPLIIAAKNGYTEIVRLLLEHHASPNAQDKYKSVAIHMAALNNHVGAVGLLIKYQANINIQDNTGQFALRWAAHNNCIKIALLLLENHADIDAQTHNGETALMSAALHENFAAIETLILHGANTTITDKYNRTAAHQASPAALVCCAKSLRQKYALKECLMQQDWDTENPVVSRIITTFIPIVLASIICDYANPYHPAEKHLHSAIQRLIYNNKPTQTPEPKKRESCSKCAVQ